MMLNWNEELHLKNIYDRIEVWARLQFAFFQKINDAHVEKSVEWLVHSQYVLLKVNVLNIQ
jgi:hypothetical protein